MLSILCGWSDTAAAQSAGATSAAPRPAAQPSREVNPYFRPLNPYLDAGFQDFVETQYERLSAADEGVSSSGGSLQLKGMRDSVANRPLAPALEERLKRVAPPRSAGAALPGAQQAKGGGSNVQPMPEPEAAGLPGSDAEKELLYALNSPSFCVFNYAYRFFGPKYDLAGADYKVRSISERGPLALAVLPPEDYSPPAADSELAIIFVKAASGTVASAVAAVAGATGFVPYQPDVDAPVPAASDDSLLSAIMKFIKPSGGVRGYTVRGWIAKTGIDALAASPGVYKVISGFAAAKYSKGLATPSAGVAITVRVPPGITPYNFMALTLRRLNEGAGFVWNKTVSVVSAPLADGGDSRAVSHIVTVAGQLPADTVSRASGYPFVLRIAPSKTEPRK